MKRITMASAVLASWIALIAIGAPATLANPPKNPPGASLSSDDLSLWNSPAFRRHFTDSYIAETEIEPRVTADERERMQKILDLMSSNKMKDAMRLLEKHRSPASSAVFEFTLANIHFQNDRLEDAAALYEAAVEKHPKFRRAWRNLGVIRVRRGDFSNARAALARVIELGGGDAITFGLLGFAHSNLEDNLAAESAYRMANLLDPTTMDWKMGLARSFFKQQRFADAVALCGQLIEEHPDRADLWLLQANAFIGLNQPLHAAENYELVERLGQSTADSLNMLGDIYINEGLFDLAVSAYGRALAKDARRSGAERALRAARVLTARGALSATRGLLEHVESAFGNELEAHHRRDLLKLRARMAVAEGAGEEEAKVLEEIIAIDPLDGEALILLGQHVQRAGDAERAAFYYERAAGIDRYEADAKVRHAQLLVGQGKYEPALPLLRRAQAIQPRDSVQRYLEQIERIARTRGGAS